MAEVIRMPKMSDTMEEGVIASWLKKVGDEVKAGDVLAEVETDKATMELEAYQGGTLLYLGVKDGGTVAVDGVIAIIGEKGEDIEHLLKEVGEASGKAESSAAQAETAPKPAPAPAPRIGSGHASAITMPRMSDTMTEGTISTWHKKVGDKVKPGDLLAEVETDKATMELEAYEEGTLLYLGVEAGASVPVDGIIAVIGEEGADFSALLSGAAVPAPATGKPAEEKASQTPIPEKPVQAGGSSRSNGRLRVSPLARKLASELGYDLHQLKGSGEGGRIIKRDIENFVPSAEKPSAKPTAAPAVAAAGSAEHFEEVPVSQMRKTIAKRLAESKFTAPHFYLTMAIDMQKAMEARTSINEVAPNKISFNDLVVKAASLALRRHPKVNAAWLGDRIRYNHHVHIGVAVAVDEGLLVPVIRFADQKTLSQIGAEVKDLAEKARSKKLQPADWEGNTFTISNLGMFGIEEFTAIINPPDACILAVGAIRPVAVVRDGGLQPGHEMKVTLSCDHRVVDGATGAAFLQTFRELLENPMRMLA
jgi:pyruvate dehydrogenase E2 component (dihydrolipoamide acetyltransferase)